MSIVYFLNGTEGGEMAQHVYVKPMRKAKIHYLTRLKHNKQARLILDIANIMGDELDYQLLSREINVSIAFIVGVVRQNGHSIWDF